MNLFERAMENDLAKTAPLAARMRPKTLEEFEGQPGVVGPGSLLRLAIETDKLMSVIFFGPPGTGKTALANIIATMTKSRFETINAVMAGVADIRRVVEGAKERRALYGERTVLFIDEIH
ncbi:MAG: AAA family ATPase, partial [Firmicutes bacterium]|nr:AAA family ATPase [Bacillota bacterium]